MIQYLVALRRLEIRRAPDPAGTHGTRRRPVRHRSSPEEITRVRLGCSAAWAKRIRRLLYGRHSETTNAVLKFCLRRLQFIF